KAGVLGSRTGRDAVDSRGVSVSPPNTLALAGPAAYISLVDEISSEARLQLDRVFRALSDPTRREILWLLRARDLSAGEIAEHFPPALSTPSGHFNVLKEGRPLGAAPQGTAMPHTPHAA